MANVLIYDTSTGNLLKYIQSAHTPDFKDRDDVLINPIMPKAPAKELAVKDGIVVRKSAARIAKENAPKPLPYEKAREAAYPSVGDQLDMLYHAMAAGEIDMASQWFNVIKKVKEKYPKEED